MRELKFRVWSNRYSMYATEAELYMDGSVDAYFDKPDDVLHHENTDLVVEQYTGLKDKFNKEIYEGDIVSENKGKVLGIILQEDTGEWRTAWASIFGGTSTLYGRNRICSVVGNVHENPELLKGEA